MLFTFSFKTALSSAEQRTVDCSHLMRLQCCRKIQLATEIEHRTFPHISPVIKSDYSSCFYSQPSPRVMAHFCAAQHPSTFRTIMHRRIEATTSRSSGSTVAGRRKKWSSGGGSRNPSLEYLHPSRESAPAHTHSPTSAASSAWRVTVSSGQKAARWWTGRWGWQAVERHSVDKLGAQNRLQRIEKGGLRYETRTVQCSLCVPRFCVKGKG